MRPFLALSVLLLAAACAPDKSAVHRSTADLMMAATRSNVDLESADGTMFLRSDHTGYLQSPQETEVASQPEAAPSGGFFARVFNGDGNGGQGASATAGGRNFGSGGPPPARNANAAARRPRAERGVPEIIVRPPGARTIERQAPRVAAVDRRPPRARDADSLREAFSAAYEENPQINQARANVRAADEGIAVARSANRPIITAEVDAGVQSVRDVNVLIAPGIGGNESETRTPTQVALNVSQPLFRGFRTRNATRQAEANVLAERERLRATEQDVILNTAIAFLDVRRSRGGVDFRRQEVSFLAEQVDAARARLRFGEGTRTDIDQAEARLAETRALLADEESALAQAEARFRELTGLSPDALRRDIDVISLLPGSLAEAQQRSQENNPNIHLAIHEADEASFSVKTLEGEALPTVSLNGRVQTDVNATDADRTESAEVRLRLEVPIYQGGRVSAQVRQAKQALGGARIAVDVARDNVASDVASGWAAFRSSLTTISAASASVQAAQRAVNGILEELRVGQRTTIDVLNAQSDLVRAEITLLEAIRQRDGAAFVVLRNTGDLSVDILGLDVTPYNPREHYAAVKDKWAGMRTPDGR